MIRRTNLDNIYSSITEDLKYKPTIAYNIVFVSMETENLHAFFKRFFLVPHSFIGMVPLDVEGASIHL